MKKTAIILVALLACLQMTAQNETKTTVEEYVTKYNRQVKNVGYSGVGVETIIDRWEADYPEDVTPKVCRINYLLDKAQSFELVKSVDAKYLGQKPIATMKDEEGNDINYFNDVVYDEPLFADAQRFIDECIKKYPHELRYRFCKISSLMDYEKEYPEMTEAEIMDLIGEKDNVWTIDGAVADQDTFINGIQEYCYNLYTIATETSYKAFYDISCRMNGLYPKNTAFIDNLGSYWLVVAGNNKKAIKFYDKALKLDPEDQVAARNKKVAERQLAAKKK